MYATGRREGGRCVRACVRGRKRWFLVARGCSTVTRTRDSNYWKDGQSIRCLSLFFSLSLCACVLCVHLPPIVCFQFDVWFTLPSISFLVVLRFEKIIKEEEKKK